MSALTSTPSPVPHAGPASSSSQALLRAQRLAWPAAVAALAEGRALGAVGCVGDGVAPTLFGLPARTLLGATPQADVWSGHAPAQQGRSGRVHWRSDGHLLFGSLSVDESRAADLTQATHAAYAELFACLQQAGMPALLRVWNYLPRINEDAPGSAEAGEAGAMERYRRFNTGRQQAFIEAGASAFDGAPAACALGTRDGPLCISFLAGRQAALAIENPRQVSAYRYPERYGPRSPSFSRAALCDAGGGELALFISGTSSIVGHESLHPGDVAAQTRETLANLRAVIAAAHLRGTARFELERMHSTVYLRHAEDAPAVRALLASELGADAPAVREASFVEADICRHELRVEIEAHGFAAGEVRA